MTNLLLQTQTSNIIMIVVLGVLLVAMLVLPMFQRKKQLKEYQAMQDTLKAGTKVQTVGGIVGRIVRIKDNKEGYKSIVLETGDKDKKSYMEFHINAIAGVVVNDNQVAVADTASPKAETTEDKPEEVELTDDAEKPAEEKVEEPKAEAKPTAKTGTKKKNKK